MGRYEMQHFRLVADSRKMTPVARTDWPGVAARLQEDMAAAGVKSIRALAKLLAGPEATKDDIDRQRLYVQRWMKMTGGRGLTKKSAARLAAVLGTAPERYQQPPLTAEELREREVSRLQARLRQLGASL